MASCAAAKRGMFNTLPCSASRGSRMIEASSPLWQVGESPQRSATTMISSTGSSSA